jgi:hypothetical protein
MNVYKGNSQIVMCLLNIPSCVNPSLIGIARLFLFLVDIRISIRLISYSYLDLVNKRTSIGYYLAEDFQKKGIMTRCTKALIQSARKLL